MDPTLPDIKVVMTPTVLPPLIERTSEAAKSLVSDRSLTEI